MSDRTERDELIRLVAQRTGQDAEMVNGIVDAFLDEIYERLSAALQRGQSVTLKNFGGFYVRSERSSWVFKFNPCQKMAAAFHAGTVWLVFDLQRRVVANAENSHSPGCSNPSRNHRGRIQPRTIFRALTKR